MWATPAQAGRFLQWRFREAENRLTFSTDTGVQPTAQLLSNPTRLVIDLPGTQLGRSSVNQRVGSLIRRVRIGQFNRFTTRVVVEMAPGYTIDPEQVQFLSARGRQWSVILPEPQRIGQQQQTDNLSIPNFRVTQNGFFIRTNATRLRRIDVDRSRDRRTIDIEFKGADIPENLLDLRRVELDRYGVEEIEFKDDDRLILTVAPDSPDWTVSGGSLGLSIVPRSGRVLDNDRPTANDDPIIIAVPRPDPSTAPPPTTTLPDDFRVPNARVLTMIDPGHGGKDPGAIGIGGLQEKDVVLPISLEVARLLSERGVSVLMTRSDDRFISLQARSAASNRARADLFVSIHANAISLSRPDVNGVETYYYTSGRRLAETVQRQILSEISIGNRGVKRARFYVLRHTSAPSILVEVGFVTGAQDAPRLADPAFRDQMAQAIANGILIYISENF
ncbi:MAG: N-acetylmuramoyl-L-alanine amidase [Spirulina sp. SIO3F2]|nr:N-acetylmuramoyl-L-alanine amidase [Spirulina sp. SIO3F2]